MIGLKYLRENSLHWLTAVPICSEVMVSVIQGKLEEFHAVINRNQPFFLRARLNHFVCFIIIMLALPFALRATVKLRGVNESLSGLDTYSGVVWALVGLSRCVPDTVGQ